MREFLRNRTVASNSLLASLRTLKAVTTETDNDPHREHGNLLTGKGTEGRQMTIRNASITMERC
jgi:hypothetical protein